MLSSYLQNTCSKANFIVPNSWAIKPGTGSVLHLGYLISGVIRYTSIIYKLQARCHTTAKLRKISGICVERIN